MIKSQRVCSILCLFSRIIVVVSSVMPREDMATGKSNYFKIIQLLDDYPKCFIVGADNVGSKQMK